MAFNKGKSQDGGLKTSLERIRSGNTDLRKSFIEENSDFIYKTVSLTLGKSSIPENSEELEAGLAAFNYSIDSFNLNSDGDFYSYAEKNIKKQVYYYSFQSFKASKKQTSTYYNMEGMNNPYNTVEDFEEIAIFKENLWKSGITIKSLLSCSPMKPKTIDICLDIAREISQNDDIFNRLISLKNIPFDSLNSEFKHKKQVIKKYNDYITALSFLLRSKLEIIKSYIRNHEMQWKLFNNVGVVLEITGNDTIVFTDKCRFLIVKNLDRSKVGYELKSDVFGKGMGISYVIRYSIYAVVIITALIGAVALAGHVNFDRLADPGSTHRESAFSESSPASRKEQNTDAGKNADIKKNPPQAGKATPSKNTPFKIKPSPGSSKKPGVTNSIKPALVIQNTPIIPTAAPSKSKPDSSPSLSTVAPSVKPAIGSDSLYYPTVKATGAPGLPRLISDSYEVRLGEDFSLTIHMYKGNNGTMWRLYENGKPIITLHCEDNSPNDQMISRLITPKSAGTYTYRCELVNSFGSTGSATIEVIVKE